MPFPAKTYNNVGVSEAWRQEGEGESEDGSGAWCLERSGSFQNGGASGVGGMSTASFIFLFSFDLGVYALRFLHLFIDSTKS